MSRRREARPLDEHGDLVPVALMEARPAGLNARQLITATSLTTISVPGT
ncbi:hypothetical protein [Streptomyces glaucescens]|uniref:Uncharacterized protein n=1 Tax=Streptomyces glaucescens TaxID=1907 RepID=A0A089XGB6_STRGA|nr:hypothetical protein [Streptomyces glaucescens]AIS02339.1 hypothetical protein SGLAU_32025 [Streptomyces glaucescens]